ncbi:major capsid protein [Dishui Lake large algae virus 1]|nr:major capsid protein [Dishui Lake large algae virus 1]
MRLGAGAPQFTGKFFSPYKVSNTMGGGLLQLVAYGAQDVYLTGNPQITFFKVVYRRHTNFALESIEQTF